MCVSEVAADVHVHDAAPLDVVSVHGGSVEGCQHTLPCVCVLELADNEVVDSLPTFHVVEQSRKLLLSWCECVCHVCHVFVCLSAGRNRTSPSTMCACLCVTWWGATARTAYTPCVLQTAL